MKDGFHKTGNQMKKTINAAKKPRGPEPERLKLEGEWTVNVKKAFEMKKPLVGIPKPKAKTT